MRAKAVCGLMTLMVLVGLVGHLFAETPIQALQTTLDQLQQALGDPQLGEESRAQRGWDLLLARVDVREMSQRILGASWAGPIAQQEAFLAVFTAFMHRTFAPKLAQLKEARLRCRAEEIHGARAQVMASMETPEGEVPLTVRMHQQASEWKIYDVALDDGRFSLVSSYRAQLQGMLRTASFEDILHVISGKNAR
jgi:ABC-type transporter MlaC component